MATEGLPKIVCDLLRERLHSFEALEALMRLHDEPREWTATEIAARLNIHREDAAIAMAELVNESLVVAVDDGKERRWRYSPSDATGAAVDALSGAYESSRLEVMNAMTKNAFDRIRLSALTTFAEAFRLGKKGKDG